MKNKKLRNDSHSRACSHAQEKLPAVHDLLSSRLYCRPRNFTESCLAARGLYHRWGIAPRPEDPNSIECIIGRSAALVKRPARSAAKKRMMQTRVVGGDTQYSALAVKEENPLVQAVYRPHQGISYAAAGLFSPGIESPPSVVTADAADAFGHYSSSCFLRPRKVTPASPVPERADRASHRAEASPA